MKAIPFSPPYIDEDVISEVLDSLNSGWITSGPKVKALEEEISKLCDVDYSVCVNSWTSGAILVMKWLGLEKGDEVIIPAYTYTATAQAILNCGATPVLVDVNDDFTIDVDQIAAKITSKTKAIIPVDIAGLPCDYNSINNLVNHPKVKDLFTPTSEIQDKLGRILVISDAAHSIGASYNNKKVGSLTDITVLSFHAVKNITTAEGGAICINLPNNFDAKEVYQTMKLWTLNGQTKDAFTKSQAGGWRYDIILPGLKVNLPDISAAIGLAQIRKYSKTLLSLRKSIANYYETYFKKTDWAILPTLKDEKRESCYHLYPLRIKNFSESQRDAMIREVSKRGVAVNVHFIPLPMLTLYSDMGYKIEDYPNSFKQYSGEISLPIYPQLSIEEVSYICKSIEEAYLEVTKS